MGANRHGSRPSSTSLRELPLLARVLPLHLPLFPVRRDLVPPAALLPLGLLAAAGMAEVLGGAVRTVRACTFLVRARVAGHSSSSRRWGKGASPGARRIPSPSAHAARSTTSCSGTGAGATSG